MFKFTFKWAWHTFAPSMFASSMLCLRLFCYIKTETWVFTFNFRQKNIRTKGYHWFLNVYANEFATHSLINVFAPMVLSLRLCFVFKNIRFFLLFLLRILCFALQFFCHDGHSDVWAEACFCTNSRMDIICILMFFCSYVFYLLLLCVLAGTSAKRVLQGETWSLFY